MEKKALVYITEVRVVCPNCEEPLKIVGEHDFSDCYSEEWDILAKNRHVSCPHCRVVMLWPQSNPFKRLRGSDHG